jgi:GNAT superfamily N-acetyltransferase
VHATAAAPEHGPALAALFERAGVPCYCRYWHFEGTTNQWLDRCAHDVERSRAEMIAALDARGAPNLEMAGIVALSGSDAIGWMKLAPAISLPKLYAQRLYKALPVLAGPREGVLTVACFLVDPAFRHQGVAETMLVRGVSLARERGARSIEAFPRRAEGISDAAAWTGPFSLYARAGFDIVHDFAPYPVMRLSL